MPSLEGGRHRKELKPFSRCEILTAFGAQMIPASLATRRKTCLTHGLSALTNRYNRDSSVLNHALNMQSRPAQLEILNLPSPTAFPARNRGGDASRELFAVGGPRRSVRAVVLFWKGRGERVGASFRA